MVMKVFVLVIVALVAYTVAAPQRPSLHPNLYKNTLASNARIIGGQEAERYQFPYQASIRMILFGVVKHVCGGTLISESWVLTAGQCREGVLASYEVALGLLIQKEDHEDVQIIQAKRFIWHPNYRGAATNDIGLLELEMPAKLSAAVKIAPLPKGLNECGIIDDVYFSGWGLTNTWLPPIPPRILHWASLPRITNEECGKALTELQGKPEPLDDTMICTGQRESQRHSLCTGDYGGPLVLKNNGAVVGIAAWGISPCGTIGAPSVYTSVCSHLDFIHLYV